MRKKKEHAKLLRKNKLDWLLKQITLELQLRRHRLKHKKRRMKLRNLPESLSKRD